MKIDLTDDEKLSKPVKLATRTDGDVLWLVGHNKKRGDQAVVRIGSGETLYSIDQVLKFSHPDAWKWEDKPRRN